MQVGAYRLAPIKRVSVVDDRIDFSFESQGNQTAVFPFTGSVSSQNWSLRLNREIPTSLKVRINAGNGTLDLNGLRVNGLGSEVNVHDARHRAKRGPSQVRLKVSAGSADVVVPAGTAGRIKVDSDLSGVKVDEQRFPRTGSRFESRDFGAAQDRVEIDIDANLSSVNIR